MRAAAEEQYIDDAIPPPPAKPSMFKVMLLLVVAAAVFCFLGAYAATDALANASIIKPLSHNPDPRPKIAGIIFGGVLVIAIGAGGLMRLWSRRQFRRLDQLLGEKPE